MDRPTSEKNAMIYSTQLRAMRKAIHTRDDKKPTVKLPSGFVVSVHLSSFKTLLKKGEIKEVYTLGCHTRRYEFIEKELKI